MTMAIEPVGLERFAQSVDAAASDVARADIVKTDAAVTQSTTAAASAEKVSEDQVVSAVQQLQGAIATGPNADFSIDYLSGLSVVKVRSISTGEVVFQLPDVRAVELARLLKDGASVASLGLLDTQA